MTASHPHLQISSRDTCSHTDCQGPQAAHALQLAATKAGKKSEKPKIEALADSLSGEGLFPCSVYLLAVSSHGGRVKLALWSLL
jgi:hypothetical protein